MATTITSTVGIDSNPDARPAYDSTVYVDATKYSDPNRNDVTFAIGGRVPSTYSRKSDPRQVGGYT